MARLGILDNEIVPMVAEVPMLVIPGRVNLIGYPCTDSGNAERLIALYGDNLRFSHEMRTYFLWDGRRWAKDNNGGVRLLAVKTMRQTHVQAADVRDSEPRRALEGWARGGENSQRITAMLREAQCLEGVAVSVEEMDADPHLLNAQNGIVDLRSGILVPHDPAMLMSKKVEHAYVPGADCPRFLAFLMRIMGAYADAGEGELDQVDGLLSYVQKAIGYSLTGCTSEKAVFICHGCGNNGKTTLLALLLWLLGDYATLLQIDTLMTRQENNNSQTDLADLCRARFAMTSETEEDQRLAEGKLKRVTQGMGKIKAVRKYENPITFPETHKLWMDANHKPVVRGTDNAIWNRLHLIPFEVTIPPDEIDRDLSNKLKAEAEGILAWAVQGAVKWHAEGLGRPPAVERASGAWREESDPLKDFVDERCVLHEDAVVKSIRLHAAYKLWCEENGERWSVDRKRFNARLLALGCTQERTRFERPYAEDAWRGIGLR